MNSSTAKRLPNWLLQNKLEQPERTALLIGEQRYSFGDLYEGAVGLAIYLQSQGVRAGSRVGLLMGNNRRFVEVVHALMQLKAVLVPLNLRLSAAEIGWQLDDVRAGWLLTDSGRAELAQAANFCSLNPAFLLILDQQTRLEAGDRFEPPPDFGPDELHSIIYSSGTTGRPKGVRLTYGNHYANASGSYQNLPAGPDDLWLAVLPLFHVGGLAIVLRGLFYLMPVLLQESFEPDKVNRAIDEQGVTLISVVASMLARLLDQRHDRPYPATLRFVMVGGGPVPAPLLERCARAGVPVMQTYGLTETASQAVTLAPVDALRKLGSAGKPLPEVELQIEGPEEAEGVATIGEILLRGPNITAGYEGRLEETALAWRGGWFHTGDLGRLDAEGYLYVLDRRDDLIISGGENIYPAEVEAVLLSHPAIEEAGVVGAPDERWGQVVAAFVKLHSGATATPEEIIAFCTGSLGRYKLPAKIYFVDSVPRNAAGKVVRRLLRDYL